MSAYSRLLTLFALGLGACTPQPKTYPMDHDNIVTCERPDGSRYKSNTGQCREGDMRPLWRCILPDKTEVPVRSANECIKNLKGLFRAPGQP